MQFSRWPTLLEGQLRGREGMGRRDVGKEGGGEEGVGRHEYF